jgi:hypothetical protein
MHWCRFVIIVILTHTCGTCTPGTFILYTASLYSDEEAICDICVAGTYASGFNATACDDCARGMYAPEDVATVCESCAAGAYADVSGV